MSDLNAEEPSVADPACIQESYLEVVSRVQIVDATREPPRVETLDVAAPQLPERVPALVSDLLRETTEYADYFLFACPDDPDGERLLEVELDARLVALNKRCDTLGRLGSAAVPSLEHLLEIDAATCAVYIREAYEAVGWPFWHAPVDCQDSARLLHIRHFAARALKRAGVEAIPALARALNQIPTGFDVWDESRPLMSALTDLGKEYPQAIQVLATLARTEQDYLRQQAVTSLGNIGAPTASALAQLLSCEDRPDVRDALASALADLGSRNPDAIELLVEVIQNEHQSFRQAAASALTRIGEPATAVVAQLLLSENGSVRSALIEFLQETDEVVSLLELAFFAPDLSTQQAAKRALNEIRAYRVKHIE